MKAKELGENLQYVESEVPPVFDSGYVDSKICVLFGGQGADVWTELSSFFEEEGEHSPFFLELFRSVETSLSYLDQESFELLFPEGFDLRSWLLNPDSVPRLTLVSRSTYSVPLIFAAQAANLYRFFRDPKDWNLLRERTSGIYGHSQGVFAGILLSACEDRNSFLEKFNTTFVALFLLAAESQKRFPFLEIDPDFLNKYASEGETLSPMAHIRSGDGEYLEDALKEFNSGRREQDSVFLGLRNGPKDSVYCGSPEALLEFRHFLSQSGFQGIQSWSFLRVSVPFHSPFLLGIPEKLKVIFDEIGFSPTGGEFTIPLYSTKDGGDLRFQAGNLALVFSSMVVSDGLEWGAALDSMLKSGERKILLTFGPGDSVEKLSSSLLQGGYYSIQNLTQTARFRSFKKSKPEFTLSWEEYAPRWIKLQNGNRFLWNSYSRWTGRAPVFGGGMTPSTVEPDIVISAAKEGYIVELAGGGQVTEELFRKRLDQISKELPEGKGIVINLLYLDAYLWNLHVPLVKRLKAEGAPIEGITISAGIPEPEEAARLLVEFNSMGIWLNSFKPGTISQIRQVLEISKLIPEITFMMQIEGGAAGGHHSWEALEDLVRATYSDIRDRKNIILAVGGGISSPEEAAHWLKGSWEADCFMPVDAVFLGTRLMAAKECKTAESIKQQLVERSGALEWKKTQDGKDVGGVISGKSGLGADIYYASNTWTRLSELAESLTKGKSPEDARKNILEKKNDILLLINKTAKPYFGDLTRMTYTQVLERFFYLVCPEDRLLSPEGDWPDQPFIDKSYRSRLEELIYRFEARVTFHQAPAEKIILENKNVLSDSKRFLSIWKEKHPQAEKMLLLPEDRVFFLEVCRRAGKPVNFIPVLDEDLTKWIRSDSLWYSHCVGIDPDSCAWIPGPKALTGITALNEPVTKILSDFLQGVDLDKHSPKTIDLWSEIPKKANLFLPFEVNLLEKENVGEAIPMVQTSIESISQKEKKAWIDWLAERGGGFLSSLLRTNIIEGIPSDLPNIFSPESTRTYSWEIGAQGELVQLDVHSVNRNVAKLRLFEAEKAELLLFFRNPKTGQEVPFKRRFFSGETLDSLFRENLKARGESIRSFYAEVWGLRKANNYGINGAKKEDVFNKEWVFEETIETNDVLEYLKSIRDFFRKDLNSQELTQPSLSMGAVFAWKSILSPLFAFEDIDLFKLLHLSQSFRWESGYSRLRPKDKIVAASKISKVTKIGDSTAIFITGELYKDKETISSFETGFLVRGYLANVEFGRKKIDRTFSISSESEILALQEIPWITKTESAEPLEIGTLIHFVGEEVISSLNSSRSEGSIAGEITFSKNNESRTFGSFSLKLNAPKGELSPLDRLFLVLRESDPEIRLKKPYRILSEVFVAPVHMLSYSKASGDTNPIHTDEIFANLGGWKKEIVHGLWTSSQVVNGIKRKVCDGDSSRLIWLEETFEAPVSLGEELRLEVFHVSQKTGNKILEFRLESIQGETKLRGRACVTPPKTGYVFTGQGSQSQGMGMSFLEEFPEAKEVWNRAEETTTRNLGFSLLEIVRKNPTSIHVKGKEWNHPKGVLHLTQFTQVALVTKSLADWAILEKRGHLVPNSAFAGHSLGEFSALSARQFIRMENVITIVYNRGLTMQNLVPRDSEGRSSYGMSVVLGNRHVGLNEGKILEIVDSCQRETNLPLEVVNYNIRDKQYSVTGDLKALEMMERRFKEFVRGKKTTIRLEGIDVPFHSRVLVGGVSDFRKILEKNIPMDLPLGQLDGNYIPNLVALPFEVTTEFLQEALKISGSHILQDILKKNLSEFNFNGIRRKILIELLAYQLAMPVRWIQTQDVIFEKLNVRRMIDVGARGDLAGMARQTLKEHKDSAQFQILHVEENRQSVFCELDDVSPAEWKSVQISETSENVNSDDSFTVKSPDPSNGSPTNSVFVNGSKPVFAKTESLSAPLIHFQKSEALRTVLALKAGIRTEEISDTETIDEIFGGNSSKRNQALADIATEFKTTNLEGGQDKPIKELVKILEEQSSYQQPGPYLRTAFDESIRKFFPPDFGRAEIFKHLKEERLLNEEGIFSVSLSVTLALREGDSVRKGKLSQHGLATRLGGAKEAATWLEKVVDSYASANGVLIPKRSEHSSGHGGPTVDAAALEELEKKYFGIEGLFSKTIKDFRRRILGEDPFAEFLVKDLSQVEEGRVVRIEDPVVSLFDKKKIVSFRNSWQWAKKRILLLKAAILRGEVSKISEKDLDYLKNHSSEELLQILEFESSKLGSLDNKGENQKTNARDEFLRAKNSILEVGSHNPVFKPESAFLKPRIELGQEGNWKYYEETVRDSSVSNLSKYSFLFTSQDFGASFSDSKRIQEEYSKIIIDIYRSGVSFSGKKVLIIGTGPNSIAWEVAKAFLSGGAEVIVTTTSYNSKRIRLYKNLYRDFAGKEAALTVVPFSPGSFADIRFLSDWLDLEKWSPDFLLPFAAVAEENFVSALDDTSMTSLRVMLVGVQKLIGELGKRRKNLLSENPLNVLLPLSPNHGIFGRDGMYAETKLGLETLFRKKFSEAADWGEKVRIIGCVIGWVRGTGLMEANDLVAPGLEENLGVKTFSRIEMGILLTGLAALSLKDSEFEVLKADLTGGLGHVKDLSSRLSELRSGLMKEAKQKREVKEILTKVNSESLELNSDFMISPLPKQAFRLPRVPSNTELQRYKTAEHSDISSIVCIVGFAEIGPGGSSFTRWELEKDGQLSIEACLEFAWMMGYIRFQPSDQGKVWVDSESGEIVQEWEIKSKYEEKIINNSGIRVIDLDSTGFDPSALGVFVDVVLEEDFYFPVVNREEAEEFQKADLKFTEIYKNPDSEKWFVKRKKGSVLKVRKAVGIRRKVAGQIPSGWDPERYGISKELIRQVDPITIYNLYCTCEAYLRAGLDPLELFQSIHPSQVGSTVGSGMGGMKKLQRVFQDFEQNNERQLDVLQETLINVTSAWAITTYSGAYGPLQTPVAACATGGVSLELAFDLILSGKAKFMISGAFDDLAKESMVGFGDMNATADSEEMLSQGIAPSEICRPNDIRRNGFLESQGGGILLLARGDLAFELGLPVYGVLGLSASRTDGIQASIPAPGLGLLSLASESSASKSPLRTVLGKFGLTADDINIAYKHDTSTKANDKNENRLLNSIVKKLGRTPGNLLPVVSQKSFTGHSKGGAAVWQAIGLLQALEDGILSGNRNLFDVDPDMNSYSHIAFSDESISFGSHEWKAGLLTTLGFGHVGVLCLLLHSNFFLALLSNEERELYLEKRSEREISSLNRYHENRLGIAKMFERKSEFPFGDVDEETALLDDTFRTKLKNR
ncbi:hypothetical protein CH373_16575 [Leptospira perolatii]|uniref:Ketosynthase family 3 (KS3) domain-containing protein n=1 Tax=Leptospira perolatii TaxID=2023191 RepID=A0A2M9ZIS4_9LEPT|nr:type I polyketide synthase [Leptospira perolatii]PJZ68612.1 hypothetical protein CH360_15120 [Leptospira perolatii]PJZ71959.1 hypothetical protein CH373_16575 [Leptospira perolatii]